MRSRAVPELLEALGACLVVLGLIFLSLPIGLIAAGVFLVAVANAPGGAPTSSPHGASTSRGDRRVKATS